MAGSFFHRYAKENKNIVIIALKCLSLHLFVGLLSHGQLKTALDDM